MNLKFSCDMMLFDIAKWLRFLGYDTEYSRYIRRGKNRIYLTSNESLKDAYLLKHDSLSNRLIILENDFQIIENANPFSRCSLCNTLLENANEKKIKTLPILVQSNFDSFKMCSKCGRIYWKGSHYENMIRFLKELFPDFFNP